MRKIILESDSTNSTTKTKIDLTEYTEMVVKLTIEGVTQEITKLLLRELKKELKKK